MPPPLRGLFAKVLAPLRFSLTMLKRFSTIWRMNVLSETKRCQVIASLVEGNSLRATARMCDVAFNTVLKLVPEVGAACEQYQRRALVRLPCKRIHVL